MKMKLHIIFGQRKCSYEGEYGPEALDVADEFTVEDNPDWLEKRLKEHRRDKSFESVAVLVVRVPGKAIDDALFPKKHEIDATLD